MQIYFLDQLYFVKIGVFREWVVAIVWGVGGGGDYYCMMLLDVLESLEGCSKIL